MMKTIKDMRFLVTGGTSGLGKALIEELDKLGAKAATFARTGESVRRLQNALPRTAVFQADVGDKKDTHRIAATAIQALGHVDVLINNASYLGPSPLRLLMDTDCEEFETVLMTNLLGPFRLAKAILPSMLTGSGGLVVNISSDAAVNAYARWGAYSVSKAALDHLTRIFNAELREHGVHSVAVDPGDMNTPMHFQAIPDADPAHLKDPTLSARQLLDWIGRGDYSLERIKL
jgi:NAD(P)-dependent dehydrogenase (short-subunit alcohol dehydrogenase family)